jgi:hypothetical protein
MESHEILKQAVNTIGAKAVASDMNLSLSLIYKWCAPNDSPDAGGADNPLDRLAKIHELTGDSGPIQWLCEQAGGFYVRNPVQVKNHEDPVLKVTRVILREFTELLDAVSEGYENDGHIDDKEADLIRCKWEDLKGISESFVVGCEKGRYDVQ